MVERWQQCNSDRQNRSNLIARNVQLKKTKYGNIDTGSKSTSTSISAAALQQHFARTLKLDSMHIRRVKHHHSKPNKQATPNQQETSSDDLEWNVNQWTCEMCTMHNCDSAKYCVACLAPHRSAKRLGDRNSLKNQTLAQRMGLVEGPAPELSGEQWELIISSCKRRNDSSYPCPICQQKFGLKDQVITSCSHVFHRICLLSFEKFVRSSDRSCPVCRCKDYQKHSCTLGIQSHLNSCVTLLSSWWRSVTQQIKYKISLRKYYLEGKGTAEQRRKHFAQKLVETSNKFIGLMSNHHDAVEALFEQCDRNIQASREILGGPNNSVAETSGDMNSLTNSKLPKRQWHLLKQAAITRGIEDCPICVTEMCISPATCDVPPKEAKHVVLLSCTHVFHLDCMVSFEGYNAGEGIHICPLCRDPYERVLIHTI